MGSAFCPKPELYLTGHDPQKIFRELAEMGECKVTANDENVVALDKHDVAGSQLTWQIELKTSSLENEIQAVFEWVLDACDLTIEEVEALLARDMEAVLSKPEILPVVSSEPSRPTVVASGCCTSPTFLLI